MGSVTLASQSLHSPHLDRDLLQGKAITTSLLYYFLFQTLAMSHSKKHYQPTFGTAFDSDEDVRMHTILTII